MSLYLLNSLITPIKDHYALFEIKQISIEEARKIIQTKPSFVSAVGHNATAQLMSLALGVEVPANRVSIYFSKGDEAIALVLMRRLAEGQIIKTMEELESIGYTLYYIRRVE